MRVGYVRKITKLVLDLELDRVSCSNLATFKGLE